MDKINKIKILLNIAFILGFLLIGYYAITVDLEKANECIEKYNNCMNLTKIANITGFYNFTTK